MFKTPVSAARTLITGLHDDPAAALRDLEQKINDARDLFAHQLLELSDRRPFSVSVVSVSHTMEAPDDGASFATAVIELQAR